MRVCVCEGVSKTSVKYIVCIFKALMHLCHLNISQYQGPLIEYMTVIQTQLEYAWESKTEAQETSVAF